MEEASDHSFLWLWSLDNWFWRNWWKNTKMLLWSVMKNNRSIGYYVININIFWSLLPCCHKNICRQKKLRKKLFVRGKSEPTYVFYKLDSFFLYSLHFSNLLLLVFLCTLYYKQARNSSCRRQINLLLISIYQGLGYCFVILFSASLFCNTWELLRCGLILSSSEVRNRAVWFLKFRVSIETHNTKCFSSKYCKHILCRLSKLECCYRNFSIGSC